MGGSFGQRLEFEHIKQATEIANQMRGTPVKLTYSAARRISPRISPAISPWAGRAWRVANGQVMAIDVDIAAPSVIASQVSAHRHVGAGTRQRRSRRGRGTIPTAMPDFRMRAYRAEGLAPSSSWRAVGAPGAGFIFDTFLDELIHAAGADPMEERIRLIDHDVSRQVLEKAAEISNWGAPLEANQGKGIAFVESFGVPMAEVVQVTHTDMGIRIDKVWAVCDVGTIIDPVNFENLVQGGVVFGLGHAMNCEITYSDGRAQQENYYDHEAMRMHQCPDIVVVGLENGTKIRGIGEPPVPPAAPALGNAIFAATGVRLRSLPFRGGIEFRVT
jgi:isoquinoline 1-oxidoreductase beta subunit